MGLRKDCIVKSCQKVGEVRGLCSRHYPMFKRVGAFDKAELPCKKELCSGSYFQDNLCFDHFKELTDPKICEIDSCRRKKHAQKLCIQHYRKFYYSGALKHSRETCQVENCNERYYKDGYCLEHIELTTKFLKKRKKKKSRSVKKLHCFVIDCKEPLAEELLCKKHAWAKWAGKDLALDVERIQKSMRTS